MPERTVRHALYTYKKDGITRQAFRGETVTVSQADIDATPDAFLPEGQTEVQPAGAPAGISPEATDEELVAWAIGTTIIEQMDFIARNEDEYPDLAGRLADANEQVFDQRKSLLYPTAATVDPGEVENLTVNPEGISTIDPPVLSEVETVPVATTEGENITDQVADDGEITYEELVAKNAGDVVAYLGRNPDEVDEVAEAENARPGGPRSSVLRAVEAAQATQA